MNFHMLLKESIEDESEGITRYEKLAAMAPSEYAPILRDIAKEESQYLEFLSEIAGKTAHMYDDGETGTPSQNENSETPSPMQDDQLKHLQNDMVEIKSLLVEVLTVLKRNGHTGDKTIDSPDATETGQMPDAEDETPAKDDVSTMSAPMGIIH
ncbi:MAG: ferritin-like domain-containing protein [Treponema sp.]|nr:ferritin-like domain-containing protein [Treponema sp.]